MSERKSPSSRRRAHHDASSKDVGRETSSQLLYPFLWQTRLEPQDVLAIQENALAVVSHGVTIADASKQGFPLIYVNETFCAMTGYTPAEALGKNCKFLQGRDTEQENVERLRNALQQGVGCTVILKNHRKDNSSFWNEVTLTPVYNTKGKVTHVIGVQHDVTRRIEAEKNLLQTKRDLERTTLEMAQITLELERANERHYHEAKHDPLTGLANRLRFNDHLNHVLERGKRQPGLCFAVLYLDLDDFKQVNDTYGHEAGDALLVEVAQRLKMCVRPSDTAARLGGDEFAILLEDLTGFKEASAVVERLRNMLSEPFKREVQRISAQQNLDNEQTLGISASIGIATYTDIQRDQTASQVLRDADTAMYEAKKSRKR